MPIFATLIPNKETLCTLVVLTCYMNEAEF